MPCYHPLPAWYSQTLTDSGKRGITFRMDEGFKDWQISVPCGTCLGCRLDYAQKWAMRCMHEAKCWDDNHFVTLTYDDSHLPENGSLVVRDLQLFMKRLRKRFGEGIRFFAVGEYGERRSRPHYHILLFNCSISDLVYSGDSPSGARLYRSAMLEGVWGLGYVHIGTVTYQSAGYCARYSLKKVRGSAAIEHYRGRVPEFAVMSRRPGIGRIWADKYLKEWYDSDSCIVDGKERKPPRYYDDLCSKLYPELYARVKQRRSEAALASPDNSGSRLIVREVCKEGAVRSLTRGYESGA